MVISVLSFDALCNCCAFIDIDCRNFVVPRIHSDDVACRLPIVTGCALARTDGNPFKRRFGPRWDCGCVVHGRSDRLLKPRGVHAEEKGSGKEEEGVGNKSVRTSLEERFAAEACLGLQFSELLPQRQFALKARREEEEEREADESEVSSEAAGRRPRPPGAAQSPGRRRRVKPAEPGMGLRRITVPFDF